jgi:hypothetical protein
MEIGIMYSLYEVIVAKKKVTVAAKLMLIRLSKCKSFCNYLY